METVNKKPLVQLSKKEVKKKERKKKWAKIRENRALYIMLVPVLLYFFIVKYVTMGGLIIAFQDYQPFLGILDSPFVGMKHFVRLFSEDTFWMLTKNTLVIFGMDIVFAFPLPIILSLMLNELRSEKFKKSVQTIIYLPHFMSWVIVVSIFYILLTTEGDRKSTRLNSSHVSISYAVFCLKKK